MTVARVVVGGPEGLDGPDMAELLDGLVRSPGGPTALWSSSHTLAPRLLEGLSQADLDIPAECSFLTFGDSPWAAASGNGRKVSNVPIKGASNGSSMPTPPLKKPVKTWFAVYGWPEERM